MDDREGCLFTVTVYRTLGNRSGKSTGKILELLAETPEMTVPQLAEILEISTRSVEKQIAKLAKNKKLERVGPAKGGHWKVLL